MKTEIKIQELSDGRFRNAVTGRIGDSIDAVVRVDDAISSTGIPFDKEKVNNIKEMNAFLNALFLAVQRAGKYKSTRKYYEQLQKIYQPAKADRDKLLGK